MASLWIRSGYDMKVEMSAETYQVGAHFKALIEAILVAPLKSFERFFRILSSPAGLCPLTYSHLLHFYDDGPLHTSWSLVGVVDPSFSLVCATVWGPAVLLCFSSDK